MNPILTSIEDTDSYYDNLSVVTKRVKPALTRETYINRNKDYVVQDGFEKAFAEQIDYLTDLRMTQEEFEFKKLNQPWLPLDYLLWKRDSFRFKKDYIKFKVEDRRLQMVIEGPQDEVVHYETPLLTIISALNNTILFNGEKRPYADDWQDRIKRKMHTMSVAGVNLIDFGARRRAGYDTEDFVCKIGKEYEALGADNGFRGTANVHFAMKHGLKAYGTYPHKYVQYMMGLYGPRICNERAMFHWHDTFKGKLGIALTDTVTTPVFLRDFDYNYAKNFDGVRQDSGDPAEIGEMVIKHYEKLGIDPTQKVIIFSDGLNAEKACLLTKKFAGRIKVTCGIGTSLTHDVGPELMPMNHVIKATEFNFGDRWIGVCKLSDVAGKATGTVEDIACTKHECGIEKLNLA